MYFTYAEKESNFLFDSWKLREVAFDTTRRYLYYSVEIKAGLPVAPPNACDDVLSMPTPATPLLASPVQSQPPQQAAQRRGRRKNMNNGNNSNNSTHQGEVSDSQHRQTSLHAAEPSSRAGRAHSTAQPFSSSDAGNSSTHSSAHDSRRRHVTSSNPSPRSYEDSSRSSVHPFPYVVSTLTTANAALPTTAPASSSSLLSRQAQPHQLSSQSDSNSSTTHNDTHATGNGSDSNRGTVVTSSSTQGSSIVAAPTEPPPLPHPLNAIVWKKKIKIDGVVPTFKDHVFMLDDPYLTEKDFWQLEIYGESRAMQANEHPPEGPLLCHACGFAGLPERCTAQNSDYVSDRYFLCELYESLRNQFADMRAEQERLAALHQSNSNSSGSAAAAAAATSSSNSNRTTATTTGANDGTNTYEPPRPAHIRTLQSPRKKNSTLPLHGGSRVRVVLRMRNEYEMRRFWFVLQTVIGYDKLTIRPYRGLPPYDPRNGLIFAQVPPHVYHVFKMLDKAVMYIFLRCDVIGRDKHDFPSITLHGVYFCITHDTIMILRETATVARWLSLHEVKSFHYNIDGPRPYLSFVTDDASSAPDLIVLLQPPVFGREAMRQFSPALETLRVLQVVHELSFASLDIRRVIELKEATEPSVRQFIERCEQSLGRRLKLDRGRHIQTAPATNGDNSNADNGNAVVEMSCPLPHEQLAQVWREVQDIYASRDPATVSQAAIPVYENNTNDLRLTAMQLNALTEVMARERVERDEIVGMPYDELRHLEARLAEDQRSHSPHRHHHHHHRQHTRGGHLHRHHPPSEHPSSVTHCEYHGNECSMPTGSHDHAVDASHSRRGASQSSAVGQTARERRQPCSGDAGALAERRGSRTDHVNHHNGNSDTSTSVSPVTTSRRTQSTSRSRRASHQSDRAQAQSQVHVQRLPHAVQSQIQPQQHTRFANDEMLAHPIVQSMLVTPQIVNDSFAAAAAAQVDTVHPPSPSSSRSGSSSSASSSDAESDLSEYGVPGSRYITQEELKHSSSQPFPNVYTDKHVILMGATPITRENALPIAPRLVDNASKSNYTSSSSNAKSNSADDAKELASSASRRRSSQENQCLTQELERSNNVKNTSSGNNDSSSTQNISSHANLTIQTHTGPESAGAMCDTTQPNSPLGPWEPNVNDMVTQSITALHNSMALTREAAREVMAASLPHATQQQQQLTVLSSSPTTGAAATATNVAAPPRKGSSLGRHADMCHSTTTSNIRSKQRERGAKQSGGGSVSSTTELDT